MNLELFEDDIQLVDDILSKITERQYAQYMYDAIHSKYERTQVDRVCQFLINEGIAKDRGSIFIAAGENAHFVVKKGGGRYLYTRQEDVRKHEELQREDTKLSVWERKRNKWLSISAFVISIISLCVAIFK